MNVSPEIMFVLNFFVKLRGENLFRIHLKITDSMERNDREKIYMDDNFEHLLSFLYGKVNHHGHIGQKNISEWKRILRKIVFSIEKSIRYNVHSDEVHKNKLNTFCEVAKREINESRNIDQVNIGTIYSLVNIIFYLLGDMPDNWDRKTTNKINHWKFDKHRSLNYSQTPTQKANLILNISSNYSYYNLPKFSELSKKRFYELNDDIKFIEWFKETYPKAYMDIF